MPVESSAGLATKEVLNERLIKEVVSDSEYSEAL